MPDTLFIQDRMLSSWSLRGHLLMEIAGRPYAPRLIRGGKGFAERIPAEMAPARTVPALLTAEGALIWDSLAIAETLAEAHPEAPFWPADPAARGFARAMTAEMHSGYGPLRDACPMNLAFAYEGFAPSDAVLADLARLETLVGLARGRFGAGGPWLFGADFGAADAVHAPLAARILTYRLPAGPVLAAWCAAVAAFPAFRRWRALGVAEGPVDTRYDLDLPKGAWPGPAPRPARALSGEEAAAAEPVNAACPYSGKPVERDSLAEIDGKTIGFCNPGCRDKSVADAEAWPKLAPLLG